MVWVPVREEETKLRRENAFSGPKVKTKKKISNQDKKKIAQNEFFNKGGKYGFDNPSIELTLADERSGNLKNKRIDEEDVTKPLDYEFTSLEEMVKDVMSTLRIRNYTSQLSAGGRYILYTFCVPGGKTEIALICLQQHGIGNNEYTSVSVIPSSIQLKGDHVLEEPSQDALEEKQFNERPIDLSKLENRIANFYKSVKSRLLVAQVVDQIKAGGEFNFDFVMLLFLAGCIAFMGLVENSTVTLVASMLVSPLMGPILSGIFGTAIRNNALRRQGIKNELWALTICVVLGFSFGIIFTCWVQYGSYGIPQWPTPEMQARGQLRTLIGGALIATPSGAGVAMSILGGNSGSLVGVAISASLLPPAVNCGFLWSVSFVSALTGNNNFLIGYRLESDLAMANSSLPIYYPAYSENMAVETAILGIVSFLLTVVNIICIIFTGIGILKLKEVTPDKIPQSFATFWKEDIKAHREFNDNTKENPNEGLLQEARDVLGIKGDAVGSALEENFLQSVIEKAQLETDYLNLRDRVAHPPQSDTHPSESTTNDVLTEANYQTINHQNQDELKDQAQLIIQANREFKRYLSNHPDTPIPTDIQVFPTNRRFSLRPVPNML